MLINHANFRNIINRALRKCGFNKHGMITFDFCATHTFVLFAIHVCKFNFVNGNSLCQSRFVKHNINDPLAERSDQLILRRLAA